MEIQLIITKTIKQINFLVLISNFDRYYCKIFKNVDKSITELDFDSRICGISPKK